MNLLHYGLQRSGTNFLEYLLKKNYRVLFLNKEEPRNSPLHKHFRLYENQDIIPATQFYNRIQLKCFSDLERLFPRVPDYYLIISKDPYSWFLSYSKWANERNWPPVSHHYIEEYNLFYGKWLEFSLETNKIVFVKYVDLLRDPALQLKQLAKKMKLAKKIFASLSSNKIAQVPCSFTFTKEKNDYYIKGEYLKHFSTEELKKLNLALDKEVTSKLGYRLVQS